MYMLIVGMMLCMVLSMFGSCNEMRESRRNRGNAAQFSLEIVARSCNRITNDGMNSFEGIHKRITEGRANDKE